MANIVRLAKSGSDWTINELKAYNIVVTLQDVATFFGNPILPQPPVHQVILDNETYPVEGIEDTNDRMFFYYLDDAMAIPPGEESAVADFSANLLTMLQYNVPYNRYIRQRKDIPFFICGTDSHAKTDVCVMDRHLGILLLIQEDKRHLELKDPEPQLIAEAIAAFQSNNARLNRLGQQPLAQKTIPGITMVGSAPTFYKITVTQDLIDAIQVGEYPGTPTTVHKLLPPVADVAGLSQFVSLKFFVEQQENQVERQEFQLEQREFQREFQCERQELQREQQEFQRERQEFQQKRQENRTAVRSEQSLSYIPTFVSGIREAFGLL